MNKQALYIINTLQSNGFIAVIAGGAVRDMIIGIEPSDIDVATNATPEQVQKIFERTIPVGINFGVVRVLIDFVETEVATFRTDSEISDGRRPSSVLFSTIEEDAKRRDFTINGIFYDPIKDEIIDFVGGREDIEKGIVKFIGNPEDRISEDKLRMLRGIRFGAKFGELDSETFKAIKKHAHEIHYVSKERIQQELVKMLEINRPSKVLDLLMSTGLMHEILPEIEELDTIEQDSTFHPEGNAFVHTKMVLEMLNGQSINLKLAGLFHDIGKSKCTTVEDGKIKSKGHAEISASLTFGIMKNLKFSNYTIDYVVNLVKDHMKMIEIHKFKKSKQKAFMNEDHFSDLFILHKADKGNRKGLFAVDSVKVVDKLIEEFSKEPIKPVPFIDGRDLIAMGIKEGKEIGRIKNELYDLQLECKFGSKDEAIEYAKIIINKE